METTVYTKFPTLWSKNEDRLQPSTLQFHGLRGSQEDLLRAWASILSGYTGHDDRVSFLSDESFVEVSLKDGGITKHKKVDTRITTRDATAIYLRSKEKSPELALEVYWNQPTQSGLIQSIGCVPVEHLPQIVSLMKLALQNSRTKSSKQGRWEDSHVKISILNEQPKRLQGPELLHDLVCTRKNAQSTALDYYDHEMSRLSMSYQDLETQVLQLSKRIRRLLSRYETKVGTTIPILIPQSPELYVSMLAVLRSGYAFCPLQLDAPEERLKFIVKDVSARLVLTTTDLQSKIIGIPGVELLDASTHNNSTDRMETGEDNTNFVIPSHSTAYVMYTSGSTGQPKGVPVSHQAATQSLLAHDRHIPKFSRFLQFAAPTFDVSIFEIFFTLYRGSTLVVCERQRLLNDLPSVIRETQVDAAELTPTVAGGLLQRRANATQLKLLLTIGEMLTPKVVAEFGGDENRESILWGMYGPTEAAIHCTLQPAFATSHKPGNIGFPLDTVSAFIVPEAESERADYVISEILPSGFVGELAVGGFQLADGYLNRHEQTSRAFIRTKAHGVLYRTRDRARMLLDGSIECLGRISSGQVKLRGQRIELGEVRHAVMRTESCLDAVVSVVNDVLVAFCLGPERLRRDNVLASCRSWLPAFMIPSDMVILQELPRLPSGKVDMRNLEEQYHIDKEKSLMSEERQGSKDVQLACSIVESVLGRRIGAHRALKSVGLDSLAAIRVASQLRSSGFDINLIDLLSDRNIANLVESQQRSDSLNDNANEQHPVFGEVERLARAQNSFLASADVERVIPCTPLQLAMLAETAKDSNAYCNLVELEFRSNPGYKQISAWFQALAAAHDVIRSGFCQLDSKAHPYACITYTSLEESQVKEVTEFQRQFTLDEYDLRRPVNVQVLCTPTKTSVLIQMHHAIYDGWSIDLLVRDLNQLAEGPPLAKGPSFSEVSRFYLEADRTEAWDYWQDQLSTYVPTALPNFHGRKIEQPTIFAEHLHMSLDLVKLHKTANELHLGKPVFVQAAVACILKAYLGTSDVLFGTVTSGRSIPVAGIECIFGPCLATCPLRVDLSRSTSVAELLQDVQRLNHNMLKHAIISPQAVKQICNFSASQSLWDVLFVWQESLESHAYRDSNIRVVSSADRLECALTLEFEPQHDGIASKATFHNDRLSREQVAAMLRQIEALAVAFVDALDSKLEDICRQMPVDVLSVWNPSPDILQFDSGLEHAVEKHALAHPDSMALILATSIREERAAFESLTYKQLNDRANQLAHFLRKKGLKPSELIAICMDKSLDLYIAILAVLKLGLGYLPITPATPLERIKSIIDEADVFLCLSLRSVFSTLALESVCEVLNVDTVDLSKLPTHDLETPYDGERAAYAVFTSGSTGTPKGVLVTQQNLRSNLSVLSELYPTSDSDRLLQSCSQAFDVSVFEIFFTWQQGMTLCSATNDVLFKDIEMTIRALDITHLSLTPTVAALISPDNVPSVKFLVTAGEGVTQKVKNAWSGRGLYQGYGPSETTNICTVKADVQGFDLIQNIGPAFRNTSAFVIDAATDLILPFGSVGELCFGGDQVFRGYINQPDLTASRFIQHPDYGRLYRSGDSGRMLTDGSILFAARLDDQVKIRGQRVELNEINHCILNAMDVMDCATLVLGGNTSSSTLVSFFVPTGVTPTSRHSLLLPIDDRISTQVSSIVAQIGRRLPSYMLPAALIPIAEIPMTVQGKIDRRRLIAAYDRLTAGDLSKLSGNGDDEQEDNDDWDAQDHAILHTLLHAVGDPSVKIGRGTSFLSLGIDSISAIAFARHVSRALDKDITVSAILRNPSIARLSEWLTRSSISHQPTEANSCSLLPEKLLVEARAAAAEAEVSIAAILPCTPLQEAMLSSSSGDRNAYHNTMQFRLNGDVNVLKECWQEMFTRHDVLRTAFIDTNDPVFPFLQVVLDEVPTEVLQDALEPAAPIDLDLPQAIGSFKPPIRLSILQKGSSTTLKLSCHHALYDGEAMAILLSEVEDMYHGRKLAPPIDKTLFLREVILQRGDQHINFWKRHLRGLQPAVFRTSARTQVSAQKAVPHVLSSLETSCRELSISLLSLCQIAWAQVLYVLFDTSDVCFGNVVSGRSMLSQPLDRLVAPTFNTVPFRIDLQCHRDILVAMRTAQRMNATCLSHQLSPLRSIQSALGFTETGLFSSILLLQQSDIDLDHDIWDLESEDGLMDFPLILELIPHRSRDTFTATLHHNLSVLSEFEAREVLDLFTEALNSCVESRVEVWNSLKATRQLLANISGKIIRPKSSKLASREESNDTKSTPSELKVQETLAELTGVYVSKISTQTTIHQLGLDSIGAIQLATRLRAAGERTISVADILQHPTIADIAKLLGQRSAHDIDRPVFDLDHFSTEHIHEVCQQNGISVTDVQHVWPCTPIQMGLVSQFLRDESVYVNHVSYQLPTGISTALLDQAWKSTVSCHDMLRTGFVALDENSQFPFAMVNYRPGASDTPVRTVTKSAFDLQIWRSENTSRFNKDIRKPPWAVCLEQTSSALLMHLSMFHGLYDATSLQLLLHSLDCKIRNEPVVSEASIKPVLSSLISLQMGDAKDASTHQTFWQQTLQKATFNPFPDVNPLHAPTKRTLTCTKTLNLDLQQLEQKCRALGYAVQAVGQAAWARILATYLGEESVCFGLVLSGRDVMLDAEKVAFPCLVTVPFGASLTDQTNDAFVKTAMQFNSAVRRHQFNRLSDIGRWTSRDILFDTIFAYQKTVKVSPNRPWEIIDELSNDEFSFALELEPTFSGDLIARGTFKENLISIDHAKLILDQFDAVVDDILSHPDSTASHFSETPNHLLSITPPEVSALDSPVQLLHEFVEMQAQSIPTKIAFEFFVRSEHGNLVSRTWCYQDLNAEGDRISDWIGSLGIAGGSYIGICFDKCPEASFAILGILKAGCAYVAIDPSAPLARKSFIANDSGMVLLLTSTRQAETLEDAQWEIPIVPLNGALPAKVTITKAPNNSSALNAGSVCYCLYTSGTTGTPKGCEITHRNAVQAMRAFSKLFCGRWDETSRWLQFASFHFDVSVLEQYWSWSEGICVVSASRDLIFEDLEATIQEMGITHIDLTPSLASLVKPENVPSLCKGVFITGGEQLKQEILDVWRKHEVIHNGYGPTETTIGVTMYTRVPQNGKPANIGKQFANVGSYVFHVGTDIPVLRGGIGELCIFGELVGKGYLNRPELTHEKFPLIDAYGERVYRTGDLVRLCHDNSFLFLGRIDDQVKLRGQRLEIGEINSTIRSSVAEIVDVATFVLRHPKQQRDQLITFFVTGIGYKSQEPICITRLEADLVAVTLAREGCTERLPGYMVPTFFIPVNRMPLSNNNKTDAKVLRDLFYQTSLEDLQYLSTVETRSMEAHERRIAKHLASFCQVPLESISPSSNIFELGLDSISVLGFCNALRKAGYRGVSAAGVMSNPILRKLAKEIDHSLEASAEKISLKSAVQKVASFSKKHRPQAMRVLNFSAKDIEAISPCTPLQEGMISRSLDSNFEGLYFNTFTFDLKESVNGQELEQAWQHVCDQTQILRTLFMQTSDGYAQVTSRDYCFPFEIRQVTKHQALESLIGDARKQWIAANSRHFNRPAEVTVWKNGRQATMVLSIFHALYDGNCLDRMLYAVFSAYQGHLKDLSVPSFHDALVHGPLQRLDKAKTFWTSQVQPLSAKEIRMNGPASQVSQNLTQARELDSCRKKLGVTHQAVVQAAWMATLSRICGAARISTGVVCSGRAIEFDGAEKVIGPLFNTVPFQMRIANDDTWRTLINRCHEFNVQSLPFQHTALREINKWSHMGATGKLFHSLFVFQIEQSSEQRGLNNELWTLRDDDGKTEYPLSLEAQYQLDGCLAVDIASTGQYVNGWELEAVVKQFLNYLSSAIRSPDVLIFARAGQFDDADEVAQDDNSIIPSRPLDEAEIDFVWSPTARIIKEEIAHLAMVDEEAISEAMSIFELGLDSIDAIKLSSRLNGRGLSLPVSSIMQTATIANMIACLGQVQDQAEHSVASLQKSMHLLTTYLESEQLLGSEVARVLPATPLQEAMISEMVDSGYQRYFNHDCLRLSPGVDESKLREAWQIVYDSSPILRTSFVPIDEPSIPYTYAQIQAKQGPLPWERVQVADPTQIPALMAKVRDTARSCGIQTQSLRLTFLEASGECYLLLSLSHALYDGYSLNLLHHDVQTAYYSGKVQQRPDADTVLQEVAYATNSSHDEQFWSDYLADTKSCIIQQGQAVPAPSQEYAVHRTEIRSKMKAKALRTFCKEQGITPQTFALSCYSLILASYMGRIDPVFGVVLSGRDSEVAQQIVFPTMNTVAFKSLLSGTKSSFLHSIQESMAAVRAHQYFPLARAQRFAQAAGQRLFNSLFIYQSNDGIETEASHLYDSVQSSSDLEVPVSVEMEILNGEVVWRAACHNEVLSRADTDDLLRRLDGAAKHLSVSTEAELLLICGQTITIGDLASFKTEDETSTTSDRQVAANEEAQVDMPLSPTAEIVRAVLARVAQTSESEINPSTSLYHIGLDSISAIKVCSLLKKQGINLTVSHLLRASTLSNIVAMADESPSDADKPRTSAMDDLLQQAKSAFKTMQHQTQSISNIRTEVVLPATAGQLYMLKMWERSCGRVFFDTFYFTLRSSNINSESIRSAMLGWIRARPILRTVFLRSSHPSIPVLQVVIPADRIAISRAQSTISDEEDDGHQDVITIEVGIADAQNYDLGALLPSVSYQQQSVDTWKLGVRIHHGLYDGVSLPHLLADLEQCIINGTTALMSIGTGGFSDFAVASCASASANIARKFWTQYLRPKQAYQRSTDSNEHDVYQRRFSKYHPRSFPEAKKLLQSARKVELSLPSIFLAICARAFQRTRAQSESDNAMKGERTDDTVIGVYIANRGDQSESLDRYPILNLLPLVVDTSLPTLQSAKRVQDDLRDISEPSNASTSLWQIHQWTGIHVPIFVNWLQVAGEAESGEGDVTDKFRVQSAIDKVIESKADGFEMPEILKSDQVSEAYVPHIDVEVALRDGALDLGVFGPTSLLEPSVADQMLEDIRKELFELTET